MIVMNIYTVYVNRLSTVMSNMIYNKILLIGGKLVKCALDYTTISNNRLVSINISTTT